MNLIPYYENPLREYPVVVPESPETSIARQIPLQAIRLLDRESQRKHYNDALAIGANVVNNFLNRTSSDDLESLIQISVEPEVTKGSFLGIGGSKGMIITFHRRT